MKLVQSNPIDILWYQEKKRIDEKQTIIDLKKRIITLEKQIEDGNRIKKLKVTTKDAVHYFNYKDILYLKSDSNYTYIHLCNKKKLLISKTLKFLSERINDPVFMRIHSSILINTQYLSQYIKGDNKVILENEVVLPVSKSNKKMLGRWLGK